MKTKWIVIVSIMIVGIGMGAEPNEPVDPVKYFTMRLLGEPSDYPNSNIEGWIGLRKDNSEVGISIGWRNWTEGDTKDDSESSFAYGVFAIYHLPDLRVAIENIIWPIEFLPEQLEASPGIGLQLMFDEKRKGVKFSPLIEMKIFENFAIQTKYNTYSDNAGAEDRFWVGISAEWKF